MIVYPYRGFEGAILIRFWANLRTGSIHWDVTFGWYCLSWRYIWASTEDKD